MSKFIPYDMTTTDEIQDPMYEGKVRARCIGSTLATASTGTECVRLVFQACAEQPPGCVAEYGADANGASALFVTDRYLSENAAARTMQALRQCGWKTDDMGDLYYDESGTAEDDAERFARSGLGENEVELVIKAEEFKGAVKVKVAFINGIPAPVKRDNITNMNSRLRDLINASRNGSKGVLTTDAQGQTQAPPIGALFRQGSVTVKGTQGAKDYGDSDTSLPRVSYSKTAPNTGAVGSNAGTDVASDDPALLDEIKF